MKVVIVGLGSIALKHIDALKKVDPSVKIYALRSDKNAIATDNITDIYEWTDVPGDSSFFIISNPTSAHFETILRASAFKVPLFVEKPPFMQSDKVPELLKQLNKEGIVTYTAFNFRFHPVLQWLKDNISAKRVLEVQAYCGSYLPDWRPGKDYRKIYSADSALGGGVHLDLIHEIDFLVWIFGSPVRSFKSFSKISDLEINASDSAHYWLEYSQMRISILLSYFRRDPKRTVEIVMNDDTWVADLLKGTIINSKNEVLFKTDFNILDTYVKQMEYFLNALQTGAAMMNTLDESFETLKLCLPDE